MASWSFLCIYLLIHELLKLLTNYFLLPVLRNNLFIRSRHGVIFETVGSLLSLLRTGDRDAYRQFFMDTLLLTEGTREKYFYFSQ